MDEYLNNRQKDILLKLLANPADNGSAYASNLKDLVDAYPQSGLFRAMYGRALNERSPASTGAYFDSRALYKILHHNDSLLAVDAGQIIQQASPALNGSTEKSTTFTPDTTEEKAATLTDEPVAFPDILNVQWPGQTTEDAADVPFEKQIAEEKPADATEEFVAWKPEDQTPAADDEQLGRAPWELEDEDDEPDMAQAHTQEEVAPWQAEEQAAAYVPEEPVQEQEPAPVDEYIAEPEPTQWEQPVAEEPVIEHEPAPWEAIQEEYATAATEEPLETAHWQTPYNYDEETPINEETYDEITGIEDISLDHNQADIYEEPGTPIIPVEHAYEEPFADTEESQPASQDEADRLIMGNIAATDYFVFDRAFGDKKETAEPAQPDFYAAPQETSPQNQPASGHTHSGYKQPAQNDVSRYHDEKMPYTFMWWLDKTRKEHGSLYQPYAKAPANPVSNQPKAAPQTPADKPAVPDELQQQYFENIFHLSSVDELTNDAAPPAVEFDMQSKEDRIIQRFITEDPHIHPPVGEKLDSENKAKKSSEDTNEMVTETLARIYADQMLFPKAIATYKKLMLKYPEKSRYFASRIENLEKKTN